MPRENIRTYYARLHRIARIYFRDIPSQYKPGDQFMRDYGNRGVISRQRVAKILYSVESSR